MSRSIPYLGVGDCSGDWDWTGVGWVRDFLRPLAVWRFVRQSPLPVALALLYLVGFYATVPCVDD